MKHENKKHNRSLSALLIVACAVLAALVGFVIYMESRSADVPPEAAAPETTEAVPAETTVPETTIPDIAMPVFTEPAQTVEPDLMISTPYCNLFYPGGMKEGVRASGTAGTVGYTVTVFGDVCGEEIVLFTILFAEESDNSFPVGAIVHEGVTMDVNLDLPEILPGGNWEAEDTDRAGALQEGVNYLLEKLRENPAFIPASQSGTQPVEPPQQSTEPTQTPAQAPDQPENGDLKASTPYTELYFPGQWKDSIRWEGEQTEIGYIVHFYGIVNGAEAKCFTVYFVDTVDEAIPVGILTAEGMTMDVSIALWELPENSGWSDTEQDLFYALQEKINYMLDRLKENPGFVPVEP